MQVKEAPMMMKTHIIGAFGMFHSYMVHHSLDRSHELVEVYRERSASKLEVFKGRITVIPGGTNDRQVIQQAVA